MTENSIQSISRRLTEPVYRLLSVFSSYGRCRHCRICWKYRDYMFSVPYGVGQSAFPLCQRCFDECTSEEITQYFITLWLNDWERDPDPAAWETFRDHTKLRKGEPNRLVPTVDTGEQLVCTDCDERMQYDPQTDLFTCECRSFEIALGQNGEREISTLNMNGGHETTAGDLNVRIETEEYDD